MQDRAKSWRPLTTEIRTISTTITSTITRRVIGPRPPVGSPHALD